jgi:hypothetical protein
MDPEKIAGITPVITVQPRPQSPSPSRPAAPPDLTLNATRSRSVLSPTTLIAVESTSDGESDIRADSSKPADDTSSTSDGFYWQSPASMVACFMTGVLVALGHHLYYNSLNGDVLGNIDEQQRKLRLGPSLLFS